MVGARTFVAIGDGGLLADEERAIVPEPVRVPVVPCGMDLKMLGGIFIGNCGGLLIAVAENDLP